MHQHQQGFSSAGLGQDISTIGALSMGKQVGSNSEIDGQLLEMQSAIATLEDTTAKLAARLSPVMTPVPVNSSNAKADQPRSSMSPLGETMRGQRERVHAVNAVLRDLIQTLAV